MNICINRLEISACVGTLHAMHSDIIHNGRVSLAVLLPDPDDSEINEQWYINHWGVRRDVMDSQVEYIPEVESLNATFSTAYSPPDMWLRALAVKYTDARISLFSGCRRSDFHLHHSAQHGVVTLELTESIMHHKDYWSTVLRKALSR